MTGEGTANHPSSLHREAHHGDGLVGDNEAQLRALLTASSDVMYRMSPDWSEMRRLDGCGSLTDTTGPTIKWWDEYIFAEDRPHIRDVIDEAIRTRGVFELEHRVRRADGTPGWTCSRAIPVLDAAGNIADWFGTAKDVTARRQTEDKYRLLFETMGQGFCDLRLLRDAEGRAVDQLYLELNPAYERLIGIPVAEARGRKASEVVPALEPWWTEALDRIARQGAPERIEHEVASLGRWFEVYVYPQGDDRLTTLYEDITDRKRAETALRESRARQTFLLAFADALRPLSDPIATQEAAARLLGEEMAVDRCYYAEFDWPNDVLYIHQEYTRTAAVSAIGAHPPSSFTDLLQFSHEGRPLVCDDIALHPIFSSQQTAYRARKTEAFILVPLVKQGTMVACLCVTMEAPRAWTPGEIAMAEEVAGRTWAAVERARAEAALSLNQQLQTTMLDVVPLGLALLGMDGRAVVANRQWDRFVADRPIPSRDAERGARWQAMDEGGNLVAPGDFPGARALRGEYVTAGMEFLYTDDGGTQTWTNVAALPLIGDHGRVTGAVCIVQDIDAAKHAGEALRLSEERLRQFGEASQDVLWIRETETLQWRYLTPAFEAIYGIAREAALSDDNYRKWLDLVVPEDREHAKRMIGRAVAGEQVTFEYRVKRPVDGQIRWLRNTDFPIRDETGKVVMIGGIGHDATELHDVERRLQTLLEGIPQLVWRAVDGGHWTWASPQWTAFTGQAEADSHDFGWLDRVHPDDREAAMTAWSHAMETGGFNVEYRLCHGDGGYSWFSTRATPLRDDAGAIVEWLGTSTDIHGLRQLQERQRILLAELQHRVRNIMAMIRSVARRTAHGPRTVDDYIEHFEGRISAMARTQTLLTRAPGAGVDLQNMVRDELEAQSAKSHHYSCRGPDVALSPKAAEVLTLAVHELATNATKYGALGAPDGLVNIEWSREKHADQEWLRLDWTELRVTLPVDAGKRKGFGTELVTRRVPYELKGRGKIEFRPTGLHARIEFPLIPGQSILQTDAGSESGLIESEGV